MRCFEPARQRVSSGCASCHGSFGELLQGALPDVGPFLVTLPIELRTHARFVVHDSSDSLRVEPEPSWKSHRLAEALLRRYQLPVRGELTLDSEIPRGKGLASSTADLVATYRAIVECHGLLGNTTVLEALLRDIEPSDGVMHEGVVVYSHRNARLLERLAPVPPLVLVAIDEGAEVDTLEYNRSPMRYSASEFAEFARLLKQLRKALLRGDIAGIGGVCTRSAEINQRRLPKRQLGAMIEVAAAVGAAGVVAAHSGTCLAVLIDGLRVGHQDQVRLASERLGALGLQPWTLHSLRSEACAEAANG
jgi:L-threonine kinase